MNQLKEISNMTPLASFCKRYNISRNRLSEIAGGTANEASKSTMQRLLHDQITDADYLATLRKTLAANLPSYLISAGLSISEINRELLEIFDKGEYQPMITERTILPKPVRQFFGLTDDPFSNAPKNRDQVFISPAIKDVVDRVIDAIKYQGFVYVSGEIGSGKTTVRKIIEDRIANDSSIKLIFPETFDMHRVTAANISRAILEDFDIGNIPNDAVSRAKKVKKVLASAYREDGIRVAVCLDECHNLNGETISALKNFDEMNSGGFQKYLSIVLFGQPLFATRLKAGDKKRNFREIYERITPIPMPSFQDSAAAYLAHRLALVNGDLHQLFDESAIQLIVQQAQTPLAVGNIANRALILSKEEFGEKRVIGEAIKTKMFFNQSEPKIISMSKKNGK